MTLSTAPETAQPEAGEANKPSGVFAAVKASAPAVLLCLGIAAHLLFLLSLKFGWLNPLSTAPCTASGLAETSSPSMWRGMVRSLPKTLELWCNCLRFLPECLQRSS